MIAAKARRAAALVAGIGLLSLAGLLLLSGRGEGDPPPASWTVPEAAAPVPEEGALPLMACPSFDRELFARGVSAPGAYVLDSPPRAGMVPHHLIASDLIAGFFSLAGKTPEAYGGVVIVSPSHFPENCAGDVVTSTLGWTSPIGASPPCEGVAEALLQNNTIAAEDNPAAVEADHGVTGLVPFVQHYLPDAPITACLLSNSLSRERLAETVRVLAQICRENNLLLVASADCSHYLPPGEAALRDEETARAIESFDFQRILSFSDSNMDSPQAVTAFLYRALEGGLELCRLDHADSAKILPHAASNPVYYEGITTYFVYGAF